MVLCVSLSALPRSAPAREGSGGGRGLRGGPRPEVPPPSPPPRASPLPLLPPRGPPRSPPGPSPPARPPPPHGAGRQGVKASRPPPASGAVRGAEAGAVRGPRAPAAARPRAPRPRAPQHVSPRPCPPSRGRVRAPSPSPLPARVSMRRGLGARTRGFGRAGTGTRRRRRRRGRPAPGPGPGPGPRRRWLCLRSAVAGVSEAAPVGAPCRSRPPRSPPAGRPWGPGGAAFGTSTGNGARRPFSPRQAGRPRPAVTTLPSPLIPQPWDSSPLKPPPPHSLSPHLPSVINPLGPLFSTLLSSPSVGLSPRAHLSTYTPQPPS